MKRQLKLTRVARYAFNFLFTLMVIRGVVGYWAYMNFIKAHDLRNHVYMTVMSLRDLQDLLLDAASGARAYVITGNEENYAPFTKAKIAFESKLSEIRHLLERDEPEQREKFEGLVELAQKTIEYQENIINVSKSGKHDEAAALIATDTGTQLIEDSRKKVAEMIAAERSNFGLVQKAVKQAGHYALFVIVGGVGFAFVVYLFLYFSISHYVVLPIHSAITTIARASTEIAATVEQREKTAFRHAASVDETITTIEELEFSFRDAAERANAAGVRASQAIELAEDGSKIVNQSLAGITDLKEKVGAIAEQTLRLSEQTSQIGVVINLVSDLADQTNLLALNAAVEAARAGDHGKGFAVVATEIRKLADQSRKSTEKVDTMVADIQKATDATVMVTAEGTKTAAQGMELAQATAAAFNNLKSSLSTIGENFQQTQSNINQQLTAVRKVTQAMKAGITQLQDTVQKLGEIV